MPTALPSVSRRRVLIGAAALAVLGSTSAACGSRSEPPDVSTLVAQLERARSDASLAAGAASAADPTLAAALSAVATERTAHAEALSDEITRTTGSPPATSTSTTTTTPTGGPLPPPTASAVVAALAQSATDAARDAAAQSGYPAGLLGSIAASCTAAQTVALEGVTA
ncbi:hypothetical protein [Mycolicibacterium sediminis]|uniref:Tat pathway signal protein n=1 Tax=Mycolicibacterium sediminis TaxID=1286180 RepID=A0A7I7QTP8_9MYCO|nr:hypothetical protein [Mycolicibacterium sediminis]BBY29390.1 Tat pathway signal protein [Mycolicibacterium sediminis]